mgnify:CR=1 FL=1
MIKATLVLEGGANRGVFTSGVLDYLMGKELYMSNVIGVSAGACNAVDYVSKQAGRSRECVIHREKEYDYVYGLKKTLKEKALMDMDNSRMKSIHLISRHILHPRWNANWLLRIASQELQSICLKIRIRNV